LRDRIWLLFFAVSTFGSDNSWIEEVRQFVDERRDVSARAAVPTRCATVPVPAVGRAEFEYENWWDQIAGVVVIEPDGQVVRAFKIEVDLHDTLPAESGGGALRVASATIGRIELERLLAKLALLNAVSLDRIVPPPEVGRSWGPGASMLGVHFVADTLRVTGRVRWGTIEPEVGALASTAHTRLAYEMARTTLDRWPWKEVPDRQRVVPPLLADLKTLERGSWRQRIRVKILGYLGSTQALSTLQALPRDDAWVDEAIARIRIIDLCRQAAAAPPELLTLAAEPGDLDLHVWARWTVYTHYRASYGDVMTRRYAAAAWEVRGSTLWELARLEPGNRALAELAQNDPDPRVRVTAASVLGDWRGLLAMIRDAALSTTAAGRQARAMGIRRLTGITYGDGAWAEPPGDRRAVGNALVEMLADEAADLELRVAAARGLGELGYLDATATLVRLLAPSVSRYRWKLATAAAEALGMMRAKGAADQLLATLRRPDGDNGFRIAVKEALARVGDPRALPLLRREREAALRSRVGTVLDGYNADCEPGLLLLEAVEGRDAGAILRLCPEPRCASELLAELFSIDELRSLRSEAWPVVDRAILVSQARAGSSPRGPSARPSPSEGR
jgi:hypothetical protein